MTTPHRRYTTVPRDVMALRTRIRNIADDLKVPAPRLETTLASIVVTQFTSDVGVEAAIKGGLAMKLRGGHAATRFTTDVDVIRPSGNSLEQYIDTVRTQCAKGWAGFTGRVIEGRAARVPANVPTDYVMRPFDIKLDYRGRSFKTVAFEVSHDEINSMDRAPEWRMSPDLSDMLARLGLPEPRTVRVLPAAIQIAQKLHACTSRGPDGTNDRAHDLVDILLLLQLDSPASADIGSAARRIFVARRAHPWPPIVVAHPGWEARYAAAADGLDLPELDEAVRLVNELISEARLVLDPTLEYRTDY